MSAPYQPVDASPTPSASASASASVLDKVKGAFKTGTAFVQGNLNANFGAVSNIVSIGGLFILVVVIIVVTYTFIRDYTLQYNEQRSINTIETARQLQSIKQSLQTQPLRNFYIKTALNCCSLGDWNSNYVDLLALQYAIMQGYRCLDFEIYSMNDKPVVAASSDKQTYSHTETFNHLDFVEVCTKVNSLAFSLAPNKDDPLLINLRIKSNNPSADFVKGIIDGITAFGNRLLGPDNNYENGGQNLSKHPVSEFMGKVIIMADISNPITTRNCASQTQIRDPTCLHQYINIGTNSPFLHKLDYELGVKNTPNMDTLIDHNKKNMSIVFPDPPYSVNVNFNVAKAFGCQLIGMMPQLKDANLEMHNDFFKQEGCAFALKPTELCYQPVVIETPPPQNPAVSFAGRNYSTDYASWSV
jgi:hypothetical protein